MFWLKKIAKIIWGTPLTLQRIILIVFSLFVITLIVGEVVFRYFLQMPVMWFEEIILYLVFWFYIAGAAYATYEHSHIKGGIVQIFIKNHPRVLACFQSGAAFLCLGLSSLLTVWSYNNFIWNLETGSRSTQLVLPLAYAQLSLPIGFILMAVYFFAEFIVSARGLLRGVPVNLAPESEQ